MSSSSPEPPGLAGTILVASPKLLDPHFVKTLVFVAEHDEHGAFGLVMNRPLDKTLADVIQDADVDRSLAGIPVFYGGPVRPNNLVLALFRRGEAASEVFCELDAPLEQVEAHIHNETGWVRAFAGYAGWGEGQLEGELADDAWTLCDPDPVLFDENISPGLWSVLVTGDERWRNLLPFLPKDPEKN